MKKYLLFRNLTKRVIVPLVLSITLILDCLHIQRFLLEINKLKAQGQLPASNNRKNFRWIRYAYAISKLYRPDSIITTHIEKKLIKYWKDTKEILNCNLHAQKSSI